MIANWLRKSIARRIALAAAAATLVLLVAGGTALAKHWASGVGLALLVCSAVGIAVWLSVRRLLGGPLEMLSTSMRRAEEGDFLIRADGARPDEIGDLARSFNTMLAKITDLRCSVIDTERQVAVQQRELALMEKLAEKERTLLEANGQMEQRLRELSLLFDITRTINSTLELSEVLQSICSRVGETLGFEEFAILLLDEETGRLVVRASYGVPSTESIEGLSFSPGEGISGIVAKTGNWLLIPDTSRDTRYLHYKGRHLTDGSFLCVPIKLQDKLIGLFNVLRPRIGAFSEGDIRLLTSLANYAALALANAQLHGRIKALSVTDELTMLANRRQLLERADLEVDRAQRFRHPFSFVMIDIDHFKAYNDTHGHLKGDEVLRKVATVLKLEVRKIDLVARYGGEEFVVMLPRIGKPEALQVAEKLRSAVQHAESESSITISAGVATYPNDGDTMADLLEASDKALFAAKHAGRNRVMGYSSSTADQAAEPGTSGAVLTH